MAAPVEYRSRPHPGMRRVLHDYLRHLAELPSPPFAPIFLPAELKLVYHQRLMVVPRRSNPALSEAFECTLVTQKIGRTWLLKVTAVKVPCWVYMAGSALESDVIWPMEESRIMLEKRDDREGPDPGWGDLRQVLYGETIWREGAYFVDSVTGAVEGIDF